MDSYTGPLRSIANSLNNIEKSLDRVAKALEKLEAQGSTPYQFGDVTRYDSPPRDLFS